VNVCLDHLVDTDLVNLVLHMLEGTNEFLRIIVVCFAPCSGILVVGDVLEQCLVVGCVLGVVC
jgi:hypothetical protein